jgi:hypothetical protein
MLNSHSLPRGARQLLHYLGKELAAVLSEALEKAATKVVHAENQWEGNCPSIYYGNCPSIYYLITHRRISRQKCSQAG